MGCAFLRGFTRRPGNRLKKKKVKIILAAVLCVLCAAAAASPFALREALLRGRFADRIKSQIETSVGKSVGQPLRLGKVNIDLWGRVRIDGVKLGDASNGLVKDGSLIVSISWRGLLKDTSKPFAAIKNITVENARISLHRDEQGKWNYPRPAPKKKKAGPVYPPLDINIKNAEFDLTDSFATATLFFRKITAGHIAGRLKLYPSGNIVLKTDTRVSSLCGRLEAEIKLNGASGWVLEGKCAAMKSEAAATILSRWKIEESGPPLDLDIFASAKYNGVGHYPDYGYTFKTRLHGTGVYFRDYDIRLEDASGEVAFANGLLSFSGAAAKFAGGKIYGDGTYETGKRQRVTLRINAEDARIEEAGKYVAGKVAGARGALTGWAYIDGPPADPAVKAEAQARGFSNAKYRADRAQAAFEYKSRELKLNYLNMEYGGASASLSGDVIFAKDWTFDAYWIEARIANMQPGEIARLLEAKDAPEMSGAVSGEILASKKRGEKPDISGTATAENFRVEPLRAEGPAMLSFSWSGGNLRIENLVYEGGGLSVLAQGSIPASGRMDINIESAQADVPTVLALIDRSDIKAKGTLRMAGALKGTASAPSLSGNIDAGKIEISKLSIDSLAGGFEYGAGSLKLDGMKFMADGGEHLVNGKTSIKRGGPVALEIALNGAFADKVAAALHDIAGTAEVKIPNLGGRVFAKADITGDTIYPKFDISARIDGLTFYDETFLKATANLTLYRDKFDISGGRLSTEKSSMKFSGTIDGDAVDIDILARRFSIDEIALAYKNELSGVVDVTARVRGTTKSPAFVALLASPKIKLKDMDFKVEPVTVSYANDTLSLQNITLHRAMETYVATGTYDLAASSLDLYLTMTDATPDTIAEWLKAALPAGTAGKIAGSVHARSITGKLAGTMDVTGEALYVSKFPLGSAALKGAFSEGKLEVEEFHASNDTSEFKGTGTVNLEDPRKSQITLDASRVNLGMLADLGLFPYPVKGLADVNIGVGRDRDKDYMYGSVYAYDMSLADIAFDQARGSFEYSGDLLTLTQLQFIKDRQRILVRGDIPLTAGGEKNVDKRFQIIISSKNFELATFNPYLEKIGVSVRGEAEAKEVVLRGSMDRPAFEGSIAVTNATVRHSDISAPVEHINGNIVASGNALSLDGFSGEMNKRPVGITGGVFFNGLTPDRFEFTLDDVNNLYVEYKKLYRGMIDLRGLRIQGDMDRLIVTSATGRNANITVHDGVYTLPETVEAAPGATSTATSTYTYSTGDKDLVVTAGRGLVVRTVGDKLNVTPSGTLRLHGDLLEPDIKGYLVASKGYLWLSALNIWFKLGDEAVIGFYSIDPLGIVPFFQATAEAHKGGLQIEMQVSGPMVNLQQLPEYQKMCGIDTGAAASVGRNTSSAIAAPQVQVGENNVSICPSLKLSAVDKDGTQLSEDALLRKITPVDSLEKGQDISAIAKSQFQDLFTSYGSSIIEKYSRIDNFDLSLDPNRDIFIQLEKCLSQKYCLRYERLFAQQEETLFEIRYRFRKKSYLLWGIDQDSQSHYEVEYRLNF